jgi:hypothetical protein
VILYVVLTLLFCHPLFLHAADHTPTGSASGDQCQTIWFFWWTQKALFETHASPYWTDVIYHPHGTALGPHLCLLTNLTATAAAGVLGVTVGAPLVYNVLLVFSFVLVGLGSFLLIRSVTGNAGAAFLASLFVAFSPYRFWHLDHLNLLSFGWGLLAIFFALRFLEKPRVTPLALAVAFAAATFYSGLTNAMLVILFLAVYVLVSAGQIVSHGQRSRILIGAVLGIAVAMLLVLPGLLNIQSGGVQWHVGWQDTEAYSADVLGIFVPSAAQSGTGPGEAYLGWLLVVLAAGTSIFAWQRSLRPWVIAGGIFLILSLGPTLQFGGHRVLPGLMPYRWLFETVPYLDLSRSPGRLVILAQLCAAVIAGQGLASWLGDVGTRIGRRWYRIVIASVGTGMVAIILLEYTGGRITLTPMSVPSVYREVADDPSIRVLCEMPIADKLQIGNWYMYWQSFHGRSVVNGYLTRPSQPARRLLSRIREWQNVGSEEIQTLYDAGVDAIIYHHPHEEARLIRLRGASAQ